MTEQLLARLNSRANGRGVVVMSEEALLKELRSDHDIVAAELAKLERAGLAEILSPLPYLVLRLKKWSGSTSKPSESAPSAYSYSKLLQPKQLNDSYRQPEPAKMGDLMVEILEVLGETDAAQFEKAIELYPPHVIREVLDRVRRAKGIRKSRTALFRHLLPRLARTKAN